MQKLKSLLKQAVSRDLLQIYSKHNPSAEDYSIVVHSYQLLSAEKKKQFSQSLNRKLGREYENMETINLLLLCDFLSGTNPQLFNQFPEGMLKNYQTKAKIKGQTKQQKLILAQSCFILFYIQYLREKVWGEKFESVNINNIHEGVVYCQGAVQALKLVIRHDFIMDYALGHSEHKIQIKIVIQNILRRSSQDLSILIRFVDKWNHIIVEESNYSIMVNDIYEQLIYISKNISKFEFLNNKIKGNIKFPRYEMNKKLNITIQKSMLGKQVQKRQFYSQKRLRTDGDMNQQQEEITESQICVKFKL